MNWLVWRQHRKQFMVVGIFLVLFAALTIPTGLHFQHIYKQALSTCGKTDTCSQLSGELFQSNLDNNLLHLVPLVVLFTPILLGLFWGVPLLAREYADGTNKLVWTQGVSRRKWLTVKLVWILVSAAVLAGAFAALNTWWFKTDNALNLDRFNPIKFETQGVVPIAYTVFAVALGTALGTWFKRTMVALGASLVLLIAIILIIVPNIRPHYETPINYKSALLSNIGVDGAPASNTPVSSGASLVANQTIVNDSNQPLNWANPPKKCIVTNGPDGNPIPNGHTTAIKAAAPGNGTRQPEEITSRNGGPAVSFDCLKTLGYHWSIQYQPSYKYWDFQRIETALYLGLAVIPVAGTYWLVLKRDA
jgi:hypothetical protein